MRVTRVEDANGSHIEPDFDPTWNEETKLRWHTAVVAHDTGLSIELYPHPGKHGPCRYGLAIGEVNKGGQSSLSAGPYHDTWDALVHISIGAQAVRAAIAYEEQQ